MTHQTIFTPVEIMPGAFIHQQSTIPSILIKKQGGVFDIVTDGKLSVGDEVAECFTKNIWVIQKVIEQRKAKGDWSGKSYKGQTPTWNRVDVRLKS